MWPRYLPLPNKRVCDLNPKQTSVFRTWMGLTESGTSIDAIPYATPQEKASRASRERWKRRFAGKCRTEPSLLIRGEQIARLQKNAKVDATARRHRDGILDDADTVASLPPGFFHSFIPDLGPWNPGGNFCPHCVYNKSPEGINNYFWDWDWRDPERLTCPYCRTTFPNADYQDNATLLLPRLGLAYKFHVRKAELKTKDWRLGQRAERFVAQPIHVSFSGNIRSLRINWSIERLNSLGRAYALTRETRYADRVGEILQRFADVYHGYPLQSYFQDVVDADPGFAVDNADSIPTVFKRNACIGVYDGSFGYNHEKTTTVSTRVATGLWGSSRIARELTTTGHAFLTTFQAYDLTKSAIDPVVRRDIEQRFLLELYLDTRAYEYITNKAGNIRAARVAFGQVYRNARETREGVKGFHAILGGQFHEDGSHRETPLYGHKPIGENLWQIPEMLRGSDDLYEKSLLRPAFDAFSKILTPWGTAPPLDDTFVYRGIPVESFDIARERFDIHIPGEPGPPSEFALYNSDLTRRPRRQSTTKAINHYFKGRHLACVGFGSGKTSTQVYVLGEDGCRIHRHAAPLNLQLYTHNWEVFPDLGYICDHPGNQWVKATPSHQTVTIDGENGYSEEPSELVSFETKGSHRYIEKLLTLKDGHHMRRAVTLIRKPNGWPILIDLLEIEGGRTQDYATRVDAPLRAFTVSEHTEPRKTKLYQNHSFYPLENFRTGGRIGLPFNVSWGSRDRSVYATILTECSELITYESPGWRSQYEIAEDPKKYFNTAILRNRGKSARFLVVYDVGPGPRVTPTITDSDDTSLSLRLSLRNTRDWHILLPLHPGAPLHIARK
ncbi:MAG: hypothetical protein CME21_10925 [Gemmatimonadetes bacterium]|nr:hypothetical protein [Gemmatimonadota bacterium]